MMADAWSKLKGIDVSDASDHYGVQYWDSLVRTSDNALIVTVFRINHIDIHKYNTKMNEWSVESFPMNINNVTASAGHDDGNQYRDRLNIFTLTHQ